MSIFYDRQENDKEVVITLKYQALFYILLLVCLVLPYTKVAGGDKISYVLLILFVIYVISKLGVNREVSRAMKESKVEVSGSKFSFSNPITYKIKK